MFIRRKIYNALLEQKNDFERIASNAVAQNGRLLDEWHNAIEEMKGIQKFNHNLVDRNEELLARVEQLETELLGARQTIQQWTNDFEDLDLAYGRLETDYDKLHEERDHYEERCRYLEGEVEDKEELEAKLAFAIQQRDYYYDLLEDTSEVHVGDVIVKEETDK